MLKSNFLPKIELYASNSIARNTPVTQKILTVGRRCFLNTSEKRNLNMKIDSLEASDSSSENCRSKFRTRSIKNWEKTFARHHTERTFNKTSIRTEKRSYAFYAKHAAIFRLVTRSHLKNTWKKVRKHFFQRLTGLEHWSRSASLWKKNPESIQYSSIHVP